MQNAYIKKKTKKQNHTTLRFTRVSFALVSFTTPVVLRSRAQPEDSNVNFPKRIQRENTRFERVRFDLQNKAAALQ